MARRKRTNSKQSNEIARKTYSERRDRKGKAAKKSEEDKALFQNKSSNDEEARENKGYRNQGENDFSWYNHFPDLISGSASIPFPYKPGMTIAGPVGTSPAGGKGGPQLYRVPGVITIKWLPSVGVANNSLDPINIVANNLYSRVRNAYSGRLYADGSDIVLYLLSLDSIFSYIAALKRIYRLLNKFNPLNYSIPNAILTAIGISPANAEDLRLNKTQLWTYINELTHMTSQFMCPAVMDYINRHYWMNDNAYTDAPSISSQIYVFQQIAFYKFTAYEATDPENVTYGVEPTLAPWCVQSNVTNNKNASVEELRQFGIDLINALAEWDSAFTISGYLMRAFAGSPVFTVDLEALEQDFTPIYSQEVLSQIENCRGLDLKQHTDSIAFSGMSVKQSTTIPALQSASTITWSVATASSTGTISMQLSAPPMLFINIHNTPQPTAEQVIIASRLSTIYATSYDKADSYPSEFPSGTKNLTLTAISGSEAVVGIFEVYHRPYSNGANTDYYLSLMHQFINRGALPDNIFALEPFDWHPMQYVYKFNVGSEGIPDYWDVNIMGDVENISTMSIEQFKQINKMCLYSEFNTFAI